MAEWTTIGSDAIPQDDVVVNNSTASEEWETTYVDNETINTPGDKSLIDRFQESFYKRSNEVQKSREQFASKEITLPEHILHSYGKGGAGMVLDFAGDIVVEGIEEAWDGLNHLENGIRWLMPQGMVEEIDGFDRKIADKLTAWWENSPAAEAGRRAISGGVKKYQAWKKENPREATNLESVVDIGLVFAPVDKIIPWKGKTDKTILKKASEREFHLAGKQKMRNKYDKLWEQLNGKNSINETNIGKVTVEGLGRIQTINYSSWERELMDTLFANGVKKNSSPTKNSQAMSDAITKWSARLREQITKAGGGSKETIPWSEVKQTLKQNIDDLIKSNPIFAEASQQSTIKNNLERLLKIIDDSEFKGNPLGVFQLRQAYDDFVNNTAKAGKLDASVNITAMDESVRVLRTTLNDIVATKLPNTPVKESLRTQSLLYQARSLILPAVQMDAKKTIQRVAKNLSNAIGLKMDYNRMMAVAFGTSAYSAAYLNGYTALVAVGVGGTTYMGTVALQTRATKIALGKSLAYMDKVIALPGANPNVVKALSADRAAIKELFDRTIEKEENPKSKDQP